MKSPRLILLLSLLFPFSLFAAYPLFDAEMVKFQEVPSVAASALADFRETWSQGEAVELGSLVPLLSAQLAEQSLDVRQRAVSLALQQQRVADALAGAKPKLGLQATPYAYTDTRVVTGVPNVGPFRNQTHSFAVGGSLSQNLGTGGNVTVGIKESSSYKVGDDAWTHTPSVSASFVQPLWIGETMLDPSYQSKQLEKLTLQTSSLEQAKQSTEQSLILQQLSLLISRQALLENRFILQSRLQLALEAVQKAQDDLQQGLVSAQVFDTRLQAYYQLSSSFQGVEDQLASLNRTLELILADQLPSSIAPDAIDLDAMLSKTADVNALLSSYLKQDGSYRQALLKVRSATLDTGMFSPSDAPQVQFSLQLSPFYSPSSNNTFFSSISELFSSSQPVVSFSIGFNATDVFRRASASAQQQAQQALLGAKTEVEQAYQAAKDAVWELHDQIRQLTVDLSVQMGDYQLKTRQLESERIKFEANISDNTMVRQRELDWYQSAFVVLGTLRSLAYQQVRLTLLGLDG